MTDNEKLERVIKGMECCSREDIGDCNNCPYNINDMHCDIGMMRDALALLKAQEPRVMTVDEMNQLLNGDTVWVEISDGRLLPMMVEDGTLMRWGYMWRICDEAFCAHEEGECAARAWTSRPDQATREAVPWE